MAGRPPMTERQKRLFSLFKMAIEAEQGAQKLYRETAEFCDDPELKGLVEGFYRDEVKHEHVLLEKYKAYRERFALADED